MKTDSLPEDLNQVEDSPAQELNLVYKNSEVDTEAPILKLGVEGLRELTQRDSW